VKYRLRNLISKAVLKGLENGIKEDLWKSTEKFKFFFSFYN